MVEVKFLSMNNEERSATFDVDGIEITRGIPVQYVGSIDDYLSSLANGLAIEFNNSVTEISDTSFQPGELVVNL